MESQLATHPDLHRFVSDPQFKTLQAYSHKDSNELLEITLSLEVVAGAPGSAAVDFEQEVQFIKNIEGILPDESIDRHLIVTSFLEAWIAMKHVLGPKFLSGSSKFSKALTEVEHTLHQTVLSSGANSASADAIRAVLTVSDEHAYWMGLCQSDASSNTPASYFSRILGKVAPRFATLRELNRADVARLVEDAQEACVMLWNGDNDDDDGGGAIVAQAASGARGSDPNTQTFPQARMTHLLTLIGRQFVWYWSDNLHRAHGQMTSLGSSASSAANASGATMGLLTDPLPEVKQSLASALKVLTQWESALSDFMRDWTKWSGNKFSDAGVAQLRTRLRSLLKIRNLQAEVASLLPNADERRKLATALHQPFEAYFASTMGSSSASSSSATPFASNSTGNPLLMMGASFEDAWQTAVTSFHRTLEPLELQLSSLLRRRLFSLSERPELLLAEFRKFPELLCQKRIADDLATERENLLGQMFGFVSDLRSQFDARSAEFEMGGSSSSSLHAPSTSFWSSTANGANWNVSPLLNSVIWLHQVSNKVKQTALVVARVLPGVNGIEKFQGEAKELEGRLADSARQVFMRWTDDVQQRLSDPDSPLALQTRGALIEFDKSADGLLRVNYSDHLVTLLREVRQLSELGYKVPTKISTTAETAEKFYRHALKLKQVANFYNTASDQIIKSQQGLLLLEVDNFERVVRSQSQKKTAWDSPEECEAFVGQLMEAAEKLTTRNRKLRAAHLSLLQSISRLLSIDLVKQRSTWTSALEQIRGQFERETRSSSRQSAELWGQHLDQQLFKVLDFQYRSALHNLSTQLPDIAADLVFKNKRLEFKPSIDQLRRVFYKSLKSFLDYPAEFRGLVSSAEASDGAPFHTIPARNAAGLQLVYASAERLFSEIESVRKSYAPWIALGTVDIDEYIKTHVRDIDDWEVNLNSLRSRRRDSERLPDQRRVDCFVVSLVPFKSTIDDQIQRTHDSLLLALKRSVVEDATQLGEFLKTALEQLNQKPENVEQMSTASKAWSKIQDSKNEMDRLRQSLERKNQILITSVGKGVDVNSLMQRWEALNQRLSSFQSEMEEDRKRLVDRLQQDVLDLQREIVQFASRWASLRPKDGGDFSVDMITRITGELANWRREFVEVDERCSRMQSQCQQFNINCPPFDDLGKLDAGIRAFEDAWTFCAEFVNSLNKMETELWINMRTHLYDVDDLVNAFSKKLRLRAQQQQQQSSPQEKEAIAGTSSINEFMANKLNDLRQAFPLLKLVTGEMFEKEHWSFLFHKLKFPSDVGVHTLTLASFVRAAPLLIANANALRDLAARAQGEITLREAIGELRTWCDNAEFKLTRERFGAQQVKLIAEWRELLSKVSDQQALIASLRDSPYFGPFRDTAAQYESKLARLGDSLQSLNQVQRKWLYLEPIFAKGALPSEQARFRRLDAQFIELMQGVEAQAQVCSILDSSILSADQNALSTMLDQLERCQKALSDFLEEKRARFPRFYFIGDDDMLEILGQAQKANVIQSHLKKLFAGIDHVQLSRDEKLIKAMCSSEGEVVALRQPVTITAEVESWLKLLADQMQRTLAFQLLDCVKDFDLEKFPSQLLCLAECITFTHQCEEAIRSGQLQALYQALGNRLADLTSFDTGGQRVLELKIKALVLDVIHNYDVVRQLIAARCTSTDDWIWHKQIKWHLASTSPSERGSGYPEQKCVVSMVDAQFDYSYEYLGNAPKLVHTPLTDKCYLVLTQGMHLGYGGNPYGPAGTGKTESVKALGCALGRQVLVFNCDEGIDFQSMGRILIGLVQSGAWGCFDEFNRLKEDQLSAVSQQIQIIQAALKNREAQIDLLGSTVNVNPNAGIFVTMNPAGKEYGGRSRLPDNLKQLFRAVAMSVPDNNLIAEVILYSEGFAHAKALGHKLVSIFSLSKQLLSPQKHYDWGLRALKTVLGAGGSLIHSERKRQAGSGENGKPTELSLTTETQLLVQALNVNTLSKLTYADAMRFHALVLDVFPGLEMRELEDERLDAALRATLEARKLQTVSAQMHKMRQLYEALNQRMGCILVGPSGCGKSTLLNVLHDALTQKLGQRIVRFVLNPKALDRNKLLGHMDNDTREWFDGVLTAAARSVVREVTADPKVRCWIVCDGDVDPEWIEALNSVLDDNKLLTLPNGERIQFNSQVNFIFECHDLQFASPATISRASMIFLSEEGVDVESLVQAWLVQLQQQNHPKVDEKNVRALTLLVNELFYRALAWVKDCESVVPTTLVGTVKNALSHLNASMIARPAFALALVRGLGANLSTEKRIAFAKEVFTWAKVTPPDARAPLDCYWDEATGQLISYSFVEPVIAYEDLSLLNPPLVQTVDMQRSRDLIMPWFQNLEPFILVGPEGCGKTLLLSSCFAQIKPACSVATIHCNAQTSAAHVQAKLMEACGVFTTNVGRVLRPKEGDRLILYLKDLNLPKPDKYNTIQLISFLQQLVTYKGFYDDNLEWLGLERVQIVAQMNGAASVGRHVLSSRFTSVVRIASIGYSDKTQLTQVYSCFLRSMFSHARIAQSTWSEPTQVRRLAACMVDLYEQLGQRFPPDDSSKHLLLTPRDLSLWAFGLLRYDLRRHDPLTAFAYELMRLFADRLADISASSAAAASISSVQTDARRKVAQLLSAQLQKEFKFTPQLQGIFFSAVAHMQGADLDSAPADGKEDEESDAHPEIGPMLAGVSQDVYHELVAKSMLMYERETRELNIELFPEILDHIASVERVLSRPGGSLLLIGDSGVGRRSAVALVASMLRYKLVSPTMSRSYAIKHFRADLKEYIRSAGVEGQSTVVLIEDHHLNDQPAFLENINSLLAAAELPGLFTPQEMEAMLGPLKERFSQNPRGARNVQQFLIARVRSNLHFALSFDARNPLMSRRLESNPALLTKCSLLWFGRWGGASLLQLPRARLANNVLALLETQHTEASAAGSSPETLKQFSSDQLISRVVYIHESQVSRSGATPRNYVSFLAAFSRIFDAKLVTQRQSIEHLSAGLGKLHQAEEQVRQLQDEAGKQQIALAAKQRAQEEQMGLITQKIGRAQERRREVDELKKASAVEESAAREQKSQVEVELSSITPILEAAKQSVGEIRKDSLAEIRTLRMPPPVITNIMTAVFMLLGQEDLSWNAMKSFLSSVSMKEQILNFDARNISPRLRAAISDLIAKNQDSFDEKKVARVNVSAAPLATWVRANIEYSIVLEKIQPLTDQLETVERSLAASREKEAACSAEAKALDDEVKQLQQSFTKTTAEAEVLRQKFEHAEKTLLAANHLLGKLSGEKARWEHQVGELKAALRRLPYHVLMAAAFVTYLGNAAEETRRTCLADWMAQCEIHADEFELLRFLSSESQLLAWKGHGLPADNLSLENAVILEQTVLGASASSNQSSSNNNNTNNNNSSAAPIVNGVTPFIIDPGLRATEWLKKHFIDKTEVVTQQDPRFVTHLELAVRFGKTLLVTEVDKFEPLLFPLLRRDLVVQGPRRVVPIGDKMIDVAAGFRLMLLTRNPNPDLSPDAAALVAEVNFTVTSSGLESQLLGLTLHSENPELEGRKSALLHEEEMLKVQLSSLEKELLLQLATAQGNILENETLIASLDRIKSESTNVASKITHAKEVQTNLDAQREVYRPIATAGSAIFFLIDSMRSVNHMYRFSLPSFLTLFNQNLVQHHAKGQANPAAHIDMLIQGLTVSVFDYVSRSLFKADRLMFAMHFAHMLRPEQFAANEWEFFLGELVDTNIDSSSSSSGGNAPNWILPDRVSLYRTFASNFPSLVSHARLLDESVWRRWADNPNCEQYAEYPPHTQQVLTPFQRLLLVQVLRPDRLVSAMMLFASVALKLQSLAPPPLVLKSLYESESSPFEPILFVTTPGADPSAELDELATAVMGKRGLVQLAMGGGQTSKALEALKEAAKQGHWLLLQNVHLVTPWLYTLEKELTSLFASGSAPPGGDSMSNTMMMTARGSARDHSSSLSAAASSSASSGVHPRFRLWLTSEAHDNFPPMLLQQSLKLAFESPPGLRENVLRTVSGWPRSLLQGSGAGANSNLKAQLLFVLAWFHAIVQERRTFIPQGWTKFYEFSTSDLRAASDVVTALCARTAKSSALPWPTLRGLLEQALYGGRLDNDHDLRVLQTYLQQYFAVESIPEDEQSRARALTKGLVVPASRKLEEFITLAEALPERDSPAAFGLPANIEGSAQRATAAALVSQLKKLAVMSALSNRVDREQWRKTLSPILGVWTSLTSAQGGQLTAAPARFSAGRRDARNTPAAAAALTSSAIGQSDEVLTPIDSFVLLELQKAHALVTLIDNSIQAIQKVLGGALLTPSVQTDAQSLLAGNIPWSWEREWGSGPEQAVGYLREVAVRRLALSQWQQRVEAQALLKQPLRLSDLFNPATFLNAFLQHTARTSGEAIDNLKLVCSLDRAVMPSSAKLVLQVEGLLLQGCAFTNGRLAPLEANSPALAMVPPLFVAWVPKSENECYADSDSVVVPLYPTLRRERTVCDFRLPCVGGQSQCILAGVALFLTDIM